MTDNLVLTFVYGRILNISNGLVKVAAKIESAKFGTFGVVLYRKQ